MKIYSPQLGRAAALLVAGLFIFSLSSNSAVAAKSRTSTSKVKVEDNGGVISRPDSTRCRADCTEIKERSSRVTRSATSDRGSRTDTAGNSQEQDPGATTTLSANSIDFGNVNVGGMSDASTVTLTNSSNAPLTIASITVSQGFIKEDDCSNYLPAGSSCAVDVIFIPAVSGTITGSLIIDGDAADAPYRISLTGSSALVDNPTSPTPPPSNDTIALGDIFDLDFNHHDLHIYSDNDVRNDWDADGNITLDPGAMEIFNDPAPGGTRDKVLRVNYEGGNFGYRGISGGQWFKLIDDYEEVYYSFDVYFEPGFDFVKTGKLPGPRSTNYRENREGEANTKPDGTDIWTAGLIWGVDGELKSYVYHANQNKEQYGENIHWNDGADGRDTYFIPGQWHRVEIRVKLNTPGVLDGRLEGWFDGEKRLDTSHIMFRMPGGENLKIGTLFFYTFFGGGDSSFAATKDEHVYFDNFVLSSKPITH